MARSLAMAGLLLCLAGGIGRAEPAAFVPRLSDAPAAMEYWDVAARLDGGRRFVARFLITNEGPGVHTAAAVAHLVLADGRVVPIRYGRMRDGWRLGAAGRHIKIASAVLDLSDARWRVEVDSDTHGFKVRLQLDEPAMPVSCALLPAPDGRTVVTPTPARGTIWVRGMPAPQPVSGTLALTHTFLARGDTDQPRRSAEVFATTADTSLYLAELTGADGRRHGTLLVRDGARIIAQRDDVTFATGDALAPSADPAYPVPAQWQALSGALRAEIRVRDALLRWRPLELVPLPFRWLLAGRAAPQLIWSDVALEVALGGAGDPAVTGGGLALFAFARPDDGS